MTAKYPERGFPTRHSQECGFPTRSNKECGFPTRSNRECGFPTRHTAIITAAALTLAACTHYTTPAFIEEDVESAESRIAVTKHLLWINLEGAGGGSLVKDALPDDGAIKSLLPNAVYAWEGLEAEHAFGADESQPVAEHAVACASLLTGNMPVRHGISDDSYVSEQTFNPDFDEAVKDIPGFFRYITDYDKTLATLAVTPWKQQNATLLYNATRTVTTSGDEETLATVLESLANGSDRLIYCSFRAALDGGKQGGWKASNTNYTNAIRTLDDYAGQIFDALKNRPNAYFEDWFIIVTSNHGGTEDGHFGGSSRQERNMFGIFHFAHLSKSQEMNPEMVEVLRYDQSFYGVVIDSATRTPDLQNVAIPRHFYSLDSLDGGLTVECVMATRPSTNRSYVPGTQNGVSLFTKSKWNVQLTHTDLRFYGSLFSNAVESPAEAGHFGNPMIHSAAVTSNIYNSTPYSQKDTVYKSIDKWGNETPAGNVFTPRRSITSDVNIYHDGLVIKAGTSGTVRDEAATWFTDNNNLVFNDGLRWSARYILEFRIWKRALSEAEIKMYGTQIKLTPSNCPIYNDLIGYWQFYKGANGQFIKDDSLVVNQIPTIEKRMPDGSTRTLPTEPLRLRKKLASGAYVPLTANDLVYTLIPNTLSTTREQNGRMMESSLVVPTILQWFGVPYPVEATRGSSSSGFTSSKLDGVCKPYDPASKTFKWIGDFIGDYAQDLEWRDYVK